MLRDDELEYGARLPSGEDEFELAEETQIRKGKHAD
jgi:hypothetical protein